jgi:hypothetical protein
MFLGDRVSLRAHLDTETVVNSSSVSAVEESHPVARIAGPYGLARVNLSEIGLSRLFRATAPRIACGSSSETNRSAGEGSNPKDISLRQWDRSRR